MNCPKCHNPIAPGARFCGTCGQAVQSEPAVEPAVVPAASAAAWSAPANALPALPGLLQRIKNILLTPREEWPVIAPEPTQAAQLFTGYVVPLAAFAALMSFIHLSLIGVSLPFGGAIRTPVISGLITAALTVVFACVGVFLVGVIINVLAPTFGGTRDARQALKTSAYSLTPAYIGAVLALSPVLPTLLQLVAGCYGIYVLSLGLPVLMRSPRERTVGYTATVVVCTILLGVVLGIASMALGIAGHATGLMGRTAADPEQAQEQAAATVGNVLGGALGTDAKGKAGLGAAINNLVKAGEQQQAAAAAAAPAAAGATGAASTGAGASADTGNAGTAAQNPAAAVGGLMGALGGALGGDHPVPAVDFHALTALLPASLPGMKRTDARGETQAAMGVKTSSATGTYQADNGGGVQVQITDMTAVSGLMGLAGAMVQNTTSESSSGFEKDVTLGGRTVHEKFENANKHGVLTAMVAKRFQVELTGNGVDMATLEQAFGSVDVAHLEAMKDQGGPTK